MYKSINLIFIFLGLVINTYYNFWFYNRISYGTSQNINHQKFYHFSPKFQDITKRETFILIFLVFWIIFLGFFPGILINSLEIYIIFLNLHMLT